MKRMKCVVVFLCLVLMGMLLCGTALADSTQQKKIVYVVLDDSGSMAGDRWSYANYAVQVLGGLMNEGDEMRVYYLNSSTVQQVDLSAKGIAGSLKSISRMSVSGGTPFERVQTAQQAINARKVEEGAKYWLFVISDGGYTSGVSTLDELRRKFLGFVGEGIGSQHYPLEMVFCTIGDGGNRIDKDPKTAAELTEKGIYCYHAEREKDIVSRMGEIADRISGRSRLEGSDLQKVDGKTIRVQSDIPLFNFIVLSQNSNAQLTGVSCSTGASMQVSRTAPVQAPKPTYTEPLKANVFTVDAGKGHIPPGTYTLTFDKNVELNDIAVLCEPALQVVLYMDDPARVTEGGSMQVSAKILEYGTQNVYKLSQLPNGSELELQVNNGKNNVKKAGEQPQVNISSVEDADVIITGTLKIPGFPDIVTREQFAPVPIPDVLASIVGNKTLTATVEQLKHKEKYMDFQVTLNGKTNVSRQELQAQGLSVKTDLADYDLEYRDKGILRFYPKYTAGMKMGSYFVELYAYDGRKLDAGTVEVTPSTYDIQADKTPIKVKEAAFAANNQEFRFTLLVDGKPADASQYAGMAVFSELTPGNPLVVSVDKGKWVVQACYVSGMQPGSYPIMVSVNGQPVQQAAEMILEASEYKLDVNKKEFTFRQSELAQAKAKDFSFKVTLKEDGKAIAVDQVQVEGWPAAWVQKTVDAKKKTEMTVTLTGDLSVDPKDHVITLRYVNNSGQTAEEYVTVHVLPSDFNIELTPENKQLIFNDPQEFRDNTELFHFKIQVDGRNLTATEINAVTRLDAESVAGTATDCRVDGSGYVVHPKVDAAWQAGQNRIDYVVTCIAGEGDVNEARKELRFTYHYIVYTVECFAGDGISMKTTDLIKNQQSMHFRVLADNVQLGQEMVENNFSITIPSNFEKYVKMDAQVQPNGDIVITPMHKTPNFLANYQQMLIPEGTVQVTVSFKKASDTATMEMLPGFWYAKVCWHFWSLMLILWALVIWRKKRFYRRAQIEYVELNKYAGTRMTDGTVSSIYMKPKIHQWISVAGRESLRLYNNHKIRAKRRGIIQRKRSRANNVEMEFLKGMEYARVSDVSRLDEYNIRLSLPDEEDWKRRPEKVTKRNKWISLSASDDFYVVRINDTYYAYRYIRGIQ